jgi:alanine-alpha-ketoisovalerate/valine-pyruvate aminotransferase
MKKIAKTTKAKFERHGIATVLDMRMINAATVSAIKGDTYCRVSEQAINSGHHQQKRHTRGVFCRVSVWITDEKRILTCRNMGLIIGWIKFVNAPRCRGLYA